MNILKYAVYETPWRSVDFARGGLTGRGRANILMAKEPVNKAMIMANVAINALNVFGQASRMPLLKNSQAILPLKCVLGMLALINLEICGSTPDEIVTESSTSQERFAIWYYTPKLLVISLIFMDCVDFKRVPVQVAARMVSLGISLYDWHYHLPKQVSRVWNNVMPIFASSYMVLMGNNIDKIFGGIYLTQRFFKRPEF